MELDQMTTLATVNVYALVERPSDQYAYVLEVSVFLLCLFFLSLALSQQDGPTNTTIVWPSVATHLGEFLLSLSTSSDPLNKQEGEMKILLLIRAIFSLCGRRAAAVPVMRSSSARTHKKKKRNNNNK
jgi:hypothetical protein